MLKKFGLPEKQKSKTMSKGMQEKLLLSLVMSRKAELYILDEPMGGVDPATRAGILNFIMENYADKSTLLISTHLLINYNTNYQRFKRIHNEATSDDPAVSGNVPINGETAKWYRDVYRRYRDYSIVATVLVYLLQVIDANVFAYMHDFEVTDEITMNIEPALISPYNEYAMHTPTINPMNNAVGMKLGIRF
jgi:energy-coupling factor transporter ATP-binding protein EcfA2